MPNTAKSSAAATPKEVAEKAEEKTTVPAQADGKDQVDLDVDCSDGAEGDKKTLKSRLSALTTKLKANKKAFVVLGVTAAVAALAYARKQALKSNEDQVEETAEDVVDESAA